MVSFTMRNFLQRKVLMKKSFNHLTLDLRIEIQECLSHNMTFKQIAKRVNKSPTTISREVKSHLVIKKTDINHYKNGQEISTLCPFLIKPPFVCNGCKRKCIQCGYEKHFYYAKPAQNDYVFNLKDARLGIPLNKQEFYDMDKIVTNGLNEGQHLYHILKTNNISISIQSVYRYRKLGYLSATALDFPRIAKFKERKQKYSAYVPKQAKIGRAYLDFTIFCEENATYSWVEMDTVIGKIGGKCLLTFNFNFCNFMFALLLDNKTAKEVAEKVIKLKEDLKENEYIFGKIFPILLTDNGGEFANIFVFENDLLGQKESNLFFCDPYRSCQKPQVEKNHTLLRDIAPKGTSFDEWTQETVNLIFSHINSVKRKSLNGKTPFEIFSFTYGEKLAEILGVKKIPFDQVIQSPKLLKQK